MLNKAIGPVLMLVLGISVSPAPAWADEKPPEVIDLEKLPKETAEATALKKAVEAEIDAFAPRIFEMNDWMYHNPETGHMEFQASKMLSEELEKHGFEVKFGVEGLEESYNQVVEERFDARGLPTAFVAKYKGGEEHPIIGFLFEVDALRAERGAFHGCQHNQQGPVAVGEAIALSRVMEKNNIPGSVWVLHAPAEEVPPHAKMAMTKAGYFDDVDFMIKSHGTPRTAKRRKAGLGNCCMLCEITLYEFSGSPSHGTRAWQGRDAHDAARLFFTAVDMLREHSEPSYRFMGTVTKIGMAPNVTNDYVEVDYVVRNADRTKQEETVKKAEQVDTIAKAAAMATFTDVKISRYGSLYNGIESGWLQALEWYYTNEYGDAVAISDELSDPSGWDETGIGAVNVPGLSIVPAVANIPEVAGHSHENAAITISPEGHKGLVQTAKIGAAVALRLVLDPDLRAKVNEEHKQWQRYAVEEGLITEDMIRK
jgi:amidohydrolase